ncbi:MAG: ATP-binding protein [Bacteroidetes bacterium]|nr:ATP-binding protein [Bacteroidota bacterium]
MATITVADQGIGIADNEKSKIFEKFYRIGNEETRNAKGTGLGLFIVKHIVEFHKGDIKVLDNQPKGTVFKITLSLE